MRRLSGFFGRAIIQELFQNIETDDVEDRLYKLGRSISLPDLLLQPY